MKAYTEVDHKTGQVESHYTAMVVGPGHGNSENNCGLEVQK